MEYWQAKKLFETAQAGDPNAKEQIYLSYFQPVFRYIFIRTRNQHDAEDIAQTVFLKFYSSLGRFSFQKEPLAYLFTIARNTVIDHFRRKTTEPLEYAEHLAAPEPDQYDNNRELFSLLEKLDERQKQSLILRFINGYTATEIALIMETTPANIRQIQSRALNKLRKIHGTK